MNISSSNTEKILVEWLIAQRHISGFTQMELSKKLNKPQSYVSKYENFNRKLCFSEILKVCSELQVSSNSLIPFIEEIYK